MGNAKVWRMGVAPEVIRLVLKDVAPCIQIIAILFVLDIRDETPSSTALHSDVMCTPYSVNKPSEFTTQSGGTGYPESATIVPIRSCGLSYQPSTQDKDTFNSDQMAMLTSHNNV